MPAVGARTCHSKVRVSAAAVRCRIEPFLDQGDGATRRRARRTRAGLRPWGADPARHDGQAAAMRDADQIGSPALHAGSSTCCRTASGAQTLRVLRSGSACHRSNGWAGTRRYRCTRCAHVSSGRGSYGEAHFQDARATIAWSCTYSRRGRRSVGSWTAWPSRSARCG